MNDFKWEIPAGVCIKTIPKKLIKKFPMEKMVIDIECSVWRYDFTNEGVIYIYICSLMPEMVK